MDIIEKVFRKARPYYLNEAIPLPEDEKEKLRIYHNQPTIHAIVETQVALILKLVSDLERMGFKVVERKEEKVAE